MSELVAAITERRAAERAEQVARYRDLVWRAARGTPDVDALDVAARPLGHTPAEINAHVSTITSWLRTREGLKQIEATNVDKEHTNAKGTVNKAEDALRAARHAERYATPSVLNDATRQTKRCEDAVRLAREHFAHWAEQSGKRDAAQATLDRVEKASPDLFNGVHHE